jgi:hypothetical protein
MKNAYLVQTRGHAGQPAGNNARNPLSTASIWDDDLPPSGRRYPGGALRVHTAVVGGGLTGLSAAFHLLESRPDRQVSCWKPSALAMGLQGEVQAC